MNNTRITPNFVESPNIRGDFSENVVINGNMEIWQRYTSRKWLTFGNAYGYTPASANSVPWTRTGGTLVTVTLVNHGQTTGNQVYVDASTGAGADTIADGKYTITVLTSSTFTITEAGGNVSGHARFSFFVSWSRTSGVVTVTFPKHGYRTGTTIAFDAGANFQTLLTGGTLIASASYTVTRVDDDSFTIVHAGTDSTGRALADTGSSSGLAGPVQGGAGANVYTADRFSLSQVNGTSTQLTSVERSTDIPTDLNQKLRYSSRILSQNANTVTVAATDYSVYKYTIEGFDFAKLWNKVCTLSFYVKSSSAGPHNLTFKNGTGLKGYATTYFVEQADTWERKEVSIDFRDLTASDFSFSETLAVQVLWVLNAGSSAVIPTHNSWVTTTTGVVSATQALLAGTNGQGLYLTGIDLRAGGTTGEYEIPDYSANLVKCLRYFEKSYSININISSLSTAGLVSITSNITNNGATDSPEGVSYGFKVLKRSMSPTAVFYTASTGTLGSWTVVNDIAASATVVVTAADINDGRVRLSFATGSYVNAEGQGHAQGQLYIDSEF